MGDDWFIENEFSPYILLRS